MSEFLSQQNQERESNSELERLRSLAGVVERYFPDDKEFVSEMDFDETLGFVYGQLLETGEDPDEVLREFVVTESEEEQ